MREPQGNLSDIFINRSFTFIECKNIDCMQSFLVEIKKGMEHGISFCTHCDFIQQVSILEN